MQENQHLNFVAMGLHNTEFLKELSQLIAHHDCEITNSSVFSQGELYNLNFLLSSTWSVLAKLEPKLQALADKFSFNLIFKRTSLANTLAIAEVQKPLFSYGLYIVSLTNAATFHQLVRFLYQQNADVTEIFVDTYQARQTQTTMTTLTIKIQLPGDTSISVWREKFMLFCDDMNLDAAMEPDKN